MEEEDDWGRKGKGQTGASKGRRVTKEDGAGTGVPGRRPAESAGAQETSL